MDEIKKKGDSHHFAAMYGKGASHHLRMIRPVAIPNDCKGDSHHFIRPVTPADAAAITAIYNPYIERTVISFEETPLSVSDMTARIRAISATHPYIVYEEGGEILGYAYLHQWKERAAYRFAAEDSIYLKTGHERKGIGEALLRALLEEARKMTLHAVVAVITVPNAASTGLHEKLGFRKSGELREIGFKFDSWLDVGYWQLLL